MNSTTIFALMIALGSGIAIGMQSFYTNLTGQVVEPIRAAFLIHISGSIVGLGIMGVIVLRGGAFLPTIQNSREFWIPVALAGVAGMLIVTGVAFSFARIGQTAGQAALIFGQMLIAVVVDSLGFAGEPIPLDFRRILGLVVLAVAAWLLLPQQGS